MTMKEILDPRLSNTSDRWIKSYEDLERLVGILRDMGFKIVLTSGTWDLLHIGHVRYLEAARARGDFLIVGVDSDEKVRGRKGKKGDMPRPIVGEEERTAMLSHVRSVDAFFIKGASDEPKRLLKTVRPNVLIVSETTGHEEGSIKEMEDLCGCVEVLPAQAPANVYSTTAKIRMMFISGQDQLLKELLPEINKALSDSVGGIVISLSEQLGHAVSAALQKFVERRDNGGGQ